MKFHSSTFCRQVAATLLPVFVSAGIVPAAEPWATAGWTSFQNGGSVELAGAALPRQWSTQSGVAWEAELPGLGQSTPLVADDRLFATSVSGDNKQVYHLVAIDLESGDRLWEKQFPNPSPEENTNYVSRAAPTGLVHDGGVIAAFEGGLLVSVDGQGELRWQRDLVTHYGPIPARHGLASSLEQRGTMAYLWVERSEDPYLLAFDKATGETVWKVDALEVTAWSTPRLVPTPWGDHLVCSGSGMLVGFDPETGQRLWQFDEISNNSTCTPMPVGQGRFLIGASDGRGEENAGSGAASNGLIEITSADGETFSATFLWRAEKASSSFGTPVAAAGSAWIVNRAGVLFQLDLQSGDQLEAKRVGSGSIWATPLVSDGHLYLFGQKGTTTVIDLADGRPVADNPLAGDEETLYAAVAAGPRLLFRFGSRLVAVE